MARVGEKLRALLYLVTAVPMGAVGAAVLLAGWIASAVLAITPLIVPVLAGFRYVVGMLARVEAWLARTLIGASAEPAARERYRGGYWRHAGDVLSDAALLAQAVVPVAPVRARRRHGDRRARAPRVRLGSDRGADLLPLGQRRDRLVADRLARPRAPVRTRRDNRAHGRRRICSARSRLHGGRSPMPCSTAADACRRPSRRPRGATGCKRSRSRPSRWSVSA